MARSICLEPSEKNGSLHGIAIYFAPSVPAFSKKGVRCREMIPLSLLTFGSTLERHFLQRNFILM
jgi:hypothetical protein